MLLMPSVCEMRPSAQMVRKVRLVHRGYVDHTIEHDGMVVTRVVCSFTTSTHTHKRRDYNNTLTLRVNINELRRQLSSIKHLN